MSAERNHGQRGKEMRTEHAGPPQRSEPATGGCGDYKPKHGKN